MKVKKAGGKVFGAVLTAAEKKPWIWKSTVRS